MEGSIVQVNISPGGLPKRAIDEGMIGPLGIQGDVQAHPQIHGGPLQAVLIIAAEVVDALIERARHTQERTKRIPLMRKIYRTIARDVPCLFLLNDDSEFYAFSARVERPAPSLEYEVGTKYWWVKI